MNWYVCQGASRQKLRLGFALYGRTWTKAKLNDHSLHGQAVGPGINGTFTRTAGFLSSYEVTLK